MELPSGQKLTFGLLTTITLEVIPFRPYAPLPALLPFKYIVEVVFCEGGCDSASITLLVSKWRPFSCILNRGNREK
jgi:hypothetical protein